MRIRKWLSVLVVSAVLFALPYSPPANALSDFNSEILGHINDYRERLGLDPMIEHAPLSNAASAWLTDVVDRTDLSNPQMCQYDIAEPVFADQAGLSLGTPPGTVHIDQAFIHSCLPVGFMGVGSGGSGQVTFPECEGFTDHSTPLGFWCDLVSALLVLDQDTNTIINRRHFIEDPAYTHIGLDSFVLTKGSSPFQLRQVMATFRFAQTVSGCAADTVTIDMNTNGGNGQGTAGDDVILGTSGADVIDGLGGNDVICAGDGDDVVIGGVGNDVIFGGNGRDIIRGNAGSDSISGGPGDDRLLGGIDGDTINGDDGKDYIGGFGGDDVITGGPGDDVIYGGFGSDELRGNGGNDTIRGLIGNDTIFGNGGDDTLDGDRGNDVINGGPGADVVNGGNAADTLDGGDDDDIVNGGRGDDTLSGGLGHDTCSGNKHNTADTADDSCELSFGLP